MKVIFTVPGEPQGKARARTCGGHTYTPEKTVLYENLIKTEYARQCGNRKFTTRPDGTAQPVAVHILAIYGIPKSYSQKKRERAMNGELMPTKKPDADNIAKVVCDALNGVAYADDTQVIELRVRKAYGEPHITVSVEEQAAETMPESCAKCGYIEERGPMEADAFCPNCRARMDGGAEA